MRADESHEFGRIEVRSVKPRTDILARVCGQPLQLTVRFLDQDRTRVPKERASQSAATVAHSPVKAPTEGTGTAAVPGGGKEFPSIHSCTSRCGFAVHTCFSTNPCVTERLPPVSPYRTQLPPHELRIRRPFAEGKQLHFRPNVERGQPPATKKFSQRFHGGHRTG